MGNKFFKVFTYTTLGLWASKKIFDLGADIGIAFIIDDLNKDYKGYDDMIKQWRKSEHKRTRRISRILTVVKRKNK